MVLVVTTLVFAHQGFQACQEALDPRDQQVLRDHPAVMDLKEPWDREESRAMKVLVEDKARRAPRDLKDPQVQQVHLETLAVRELVEFKVLKVPEDPKDPRGLQVRLEVKAIQVLVEIKVLKVFRVLRDPQDVGGNSASLRI